MERWGQLKSANLAGDSSRPLAHRARTTRSSHCIGQIASSEVVVAGAPAHEGVGICHRQSVGAVEWQLARQRFRATAISP